MKKVITIRVNKNELESLDQKAIILDCNRCDLAEIYLFNDELIGEPDLVNFRSISAIFHFTKEVFDQLKKESNRSGIPCATIIRASFFGPKRKLRTS